MKKLFASAFVIVAALVLCAGTTYANELDMRIDGTQASANAIYTDGEIFLPIRYIAEHFEATITWHHGTRQVEIEFDNNNWLFDYPSDVKLVGYTAFLPINLINQIFEIYARHEDSIVDVVTSLNALIGTWIDRWSDGISFYIDGTAVETFRDYYEILFWQSHGHYLYIWNYDYYTGEIAYMGHYIFRATPRELTLISIDDAYFGFVERFRGVGFFDADLVGFWLAEDANDDLPFFNRITFFDDGQGYWIRNFNEYHQAIDELLFDWWIENGYLHLEGFDMIEFAEHHYIFTYYFDDDVLVLHNQKPGAYPQRFFRETWSAPWWQLPIAEVDERFVGLWTPEGDDSTIYFFGSDFIGFAGSLGQTFYEFDFFEWDIFEDVLTVIEWLSYNEYNLIFGDWYFEFENGNLILHGEDDEMIVLVPFVLQRQDLFGTWGWDFNTHWRYVFNADGTGNRGIDAALEEFTWSLEGDQLSITITSEGGSTLKGGGIIEESWTIIFGYHFIGLVSNQFPELGWSYIRLDSSNQLGLFTLSHFYIS